ncbi:hypothetical protein BC937DRAFT_93924 [Endogone sp. FLAS-F59071]|nr:hypothetical protein BC937DRAFT_93924 [Endogone sp. FLAS-F59071]|eukprot:RUS14372.1 hypothetical protein BC937DRAFT_93924 [Endogone sp. FLAS-F59071]
MVYDPAWEETHPPIAIVVLPIFHIVALLDSNQERDTSTTELKLDLRPFQIRASVGVCVRAWVVGMDFFVCKQPVHATN